MDKYILKKDLPFGNAGTTINDIRSSLGTKELSYIQIGECKCQIPDGVSIFDWITEKTETDFKLMDWDKRWNEIGERMDILKDEFVKKFHCEKPREFWLLKAHNGEIVNVSLTEMVLPLSGIREIIKVTE